jgi:hypothetical protein
VPFNYANFKLLYTEDKIPAGADTAFHTYSILKILDKHEPLIPYTAFPSVITNTSASYPSLLHLLIASITWIASGGQESKDDPNFVLEVQKGFMLTVSLAGTAGYAVFIRSILNKLIKEKIGEDLDSLTDSRYQIIYLTVSVLAFSVFIYSVSSVVKTYNDGTLGQIFAMWLVFPYYLYCMTNHQWMKSAVLLAVIASAHNLGLLMSLSATVPYLVSCLLQNKNLLKVVLTRFVLTFVVFAAPAFIFFYFPVLTTVQQGEAPESVYLSWPQEMVIQQLKPGLYYAGIIGMILALVLNYRVLGWISGWALIYFIVFYLSAVLGQRFARELSVVFGLLIGVCIAYVILMSILSGNRWLDRRKLQIKAILSSSSKLIFTITLSAAIISLSYLYFQDRFQGESNPLLTKYFTETVDRSNKFFLLENRENTGSKVIVLFGDNPWLRVATYGKFEVLATSPGSSRSIGRADLVVNNELNQILTSPNVKSTACILKKYDIDYVYISDMIQGRWYSPEKGDIYYEQLKRFQSFDYSPFFELEAEFFGENGEHLRIYSINGENLNQSCNIK